MGLNVKPALVLRHVVMQETNMNFIYSFLCGVDNDPTCGIYHNNNSSLYLCPSITAAGARGPNNEFHIINLEYILRQFYMFA
jgi:predicted secreted protein